MQLSEGSLQIVMTGGKVEKPVMQILGCKKIGGATSSKDRYRILLSDGKHMISFAMLASQLNDKVTSGELTDYSVIRINQHVTSMLQNTGKGDKRVLVIIDMDIVARGETIGKRLGSPETLPGTAGGPESSNTSQRPTASTPSTSYKPNKPASPLKKPNATTFDMGGDLNPQFTHPIESLSPYQQKWVIKVRVMNKSAIRTWSNAKGEGKLFSMELCDESGEIRATAFREQVDKFYDMIEVDKVYYLTKCQVKPANKQYTTLRNDYELTFTSETQMTPCHDDTSNVPSVTYNFTPIDALANLEPNTPVDIIAVCKETSDVVTIIARATQRELKKREVTLVDDSNASIILTLWGAPAETFDGSCQPIIAVKGARLSEFMGGKNLSTAMSTVLKLDPDIPQAHKLRGWYDHEGAMAELTNISAKTGTPAGSANTPCYTFAEVKDRQLGTGAQGDYFLVTATILLMRLDNCTYMACPSEDCNKKVIDMNNGQYRCEKCNQEYPNFKYRLLVNMNLGDYTGNMWVTCFANDAERILGMTSQQAGEMIAANAKEAHSQITKMYFSDWNFKCRIKMESYNDERRFKTVIIKVEPVNYKELNKKLINKIRDLTGIGKSNGA